MLKLTAPLTQEDYSILRRVIRKLAAPVAPSHKPLIESILITSNRHVNDAEASLMYINTAYPSSKLELATNSLSDDEFDAAGFEYEYEGRV